MKLYRMDEAAERVGLSTDLLEALESEGRLEPAEKVNGVSYYTRTGLDQMIHSLLCAVQKASWNEMEARMEAVERQLEEVTAELRRVGSSELRVL